MQLLGHKLLVPMDKDPEVALDSAVRLAKCEDYRANRRRLHEYIDMRMGLSASKEADRVMIEDAVNQMNRLAARAFESDHGAS